MNTAERAERRQEITRMHEIIAGRRRCPNCNGSALEYDREDDRCFCADCAHEFPAADAIDPTLTGPQRAALTVLRQADPPARPSGLCNNWEPSGERLDYDLLAILFEYSGPGDPNVVCTGDLAELAESSSTQRIAGRMESMRQRGIVKRMPIAQVERLIVPEFAGPMRGSAWSLTAGALRAGRAA